MGSEVNSEDRKRVLSPEEEAQIRKARRKRIYTTLAKVVTGFVVVSFTATEALMFILFGRSDPPLDQPFGILTWAEEKGYRGRALEFQSGDNRLKGYVVLPSSPRALLLVVHGVRSSSDALEPVVQYFAERNYAVMTFDGTASGRSEGSKTVGLQQQRYDIRAALDRVRQDPELSALPLLMLGHSAGAYGVAVETADSGAAASVCVSGFETPLGTMRFWAARYTGPLIDAEYPFLWIREHAVKGGDANESASEALAESGVPYMVVHGEQDEVVSAEISLNQAAVSLAARTGSQVRALLVTDARFCHHSDILISGEGLNLDLLEEIQRFYEANLPAEG